MPGYGRHSPVEGRHQLGHTQSPHVLDHRPGDQSGDLSLVQIQRDTVLSLVEIMMLLRQLSFTIKTQLKAPKASTRISCLSLCLYFHARKGFIIGRP